MATKTSGDINFVDSPQGEVIHLRELDFVIGSLTKISESAGKDNILAEIADQLIEIPEGVAQELRAMIGQRAIVGRIDGQIRARRSSL